MFGLPGNLEVEVNRGDKIPSRKLLIDLHKRTIRENQWIVKTKWAHCIKNTIGIQTTNNPELSMAIGIGISIAMWCCHLMMAIAAV